MLVGPEIRGNARISRVPSDIEVGEIIPVIASFNEYGKIIPLYLRISGESCRVIEHNEKANNGKIAEYRCVIEDAGMKKNVRLKYCYSEGKWVLPDALGLGDKT